VNTDMSAVFTPTRYKLSIEDYHKLGEAGILNEDSRVELIEGELIEMAPIGVAHMRSVNRLNRLLINAVGNAAVVSVQNPVILPPRSEPQPDFALLKPGAENAAHVPHPDDVLLIIEVADTTLSYDRKTKLPLYARAGIAEAWIVDVQAQTVEAYRSPGESGYAESVVHRRGESAAPALLPAAVIEIDAIFA
jgi:Uma2 family endonuclease